MLSKTDSGIAPNQPALKPTRFLIPSSVGTLDRLRLASLAMNGFQLKAALAMILSSTLYSSSDVSKRIIGMSIRTAKKMAAQDEFAKLSPKQSAIALHYAQTLELAITVFGNQRLAEDWLKKPCRSTLGKSPLELIDNSLGFQVVLEYLERMEYGVYQ